MSADPATLEAMRATLRRLYRTAPADTGQCPDCADTGWAEVGTRRVQRCPRGCRPVIDLRVRTDG